jgi:transcription initiation factor TFIIIB Brf1 subunit/transcription initiation factor TFIIB
VELQCLYCYGGRGVLTFEGDYICENCGVVLETPEEYTIPQPYINKIISADTDTPLEYRNTKKKPVIFIEREYGRSTRATRKKPQILPSLVDRNAVKIRYEQKNLVKYAICDVCEKLSLKPEKVLNRFESYLERVGINDTLKTDNIITNKRHKREPGVVAAGIIFRVYRNNVTIRQLRKVSGVGNKSLQKILKLLV